MPREHIKEKYFWVFGLGLAIGNLMYLAYRMSIEYYQTDFIHYYTAGKSVLLGLNPYIHNTILSEFYQDRYIFSGSSHFSQFLYPPFSLLLFVPLSSLSYVAAKLIWTCIQAAALAGAAFLFSKMGKDWVKKPYFLLVLVMIFLPIYPVTSNLFFGQINLLVLFLVCFFIYEWLYTGRCILAGSILSLAVFIKVWPVILLVPVLMHRSFKTLCSFGVSALIFLSISISVFGIEIHKTYFERLLVLDRVDIITPDIRLEKSGKGAAVIEKDGRSYVISPPPSLTISSLSIKNLFQKRYPSFLIAAIQLFFLLYTLLILTKVRLKDDPSEKRAMLLLLCSYLMTVYLIIAPGIWIHQYVIYIYVVFSLLNYVQRREMSLTEYILFGLGLALVSAAIPYGKSIQIFGTLIYFWLITRLLIHNSIGRNTEKLSASVSPWFLLPLRHRDTEKDTEK
jgi:hypothetical protein